MKITVIEPSWDGLAHVPGNLGDIRIIRKAYPSARISLVAGRRHAEELKKIAGEGYFDEIDVVEFEPALDRDTMPADMWSGYKKFKQLKEKNLLDADLIFLCSCTASSLRAINWFGCSGKTLTFLHGNANELTGWRSKNPIRKFLDFYSSVRSYTQAGGKVLVYEDGIRNNLVELLPWLQSSIHPLGHPLLQEESVLADVEKQLNKPIRIGFAGNATVAKGFPEFVALAEEMSIKAPGQYEFHSYSYLHPSCKHINQSVLNTKAAAGWSRDKFIQNIASLDFIFTWHNDTYYQNAASGIVYDGINLGVPFLARRTQCLNDFESSGMPIGFTFNELDEMVGFLVNTPPHPAQYSALIEGLSKARNANSLPQLTATFLTIVEKRR